MTGSSFAIFGGGKGANQAVAAARSGATTSLLGAVGDDDFGTSRRSDLEAEDIDVAAVATIAGEASGVALIFVDDSGENRILYVPGTTLTVNAEQARRAVDRVRPTFVLLTLELPSDALEALVSSAHEHGATVVLNATPEPANATPLLADIDVLIVNEVEASVLAPDFSGTTSSEDAARSMLALGPEHVVITFGSKGAVVATEGGIEQIEASRVETVDTTGAGDTLCGAMVAALAYGQDFGAAVRYGVRAASLAVTKAGAQAAIPTRAEIEQWNI